MINLFMLTLLAGVAASAMAFPPNAHSSRSSAGSVAANQSASSSSESKRPSATEVGLASYYSKIFDGDLTASGKIFHNSELVAAHRTYPFGTVVRVTRLDDRKSVEVRIIDRGPFGANRKKGAIIDLSRAAAEKLDMLKKGLVRVRIEVLKWGKDS
jgi:rare lipoprotein A